MKNNAVISKATLKQAELMDLEQDEEPSSHNKAGLQRQRWNKNQRIVQSQHSNRVKQQASGPGWSNVGLPCREDQQLKTISYIERRAQAP